MMMQHSKVVVVGAGSWGTAVGNIFADAKCDVTVWGRDTQNIQDIANKKVNTKYLPGAPLSENLKASSEDLGPLLDQAKIVVCGVPTQQVRSVFDSYKSCLAGKLLLNISKGIEQGTHETVSEIFGELAPDATYAVLSGPNFAKEVVRRLPSATTIASRDSAAASSLQGLLSNPYFRVYTSSDVSGVELSGALKNVMAIATGVVSGLEPGYNAQAALINRGIAEMTRLGHAKGAQTLTFLGLAGMGDLVLTCTGPLSRNRTFGVSLGKGRDLEQARQELGGVAEGYFTAKSASELGKQLGIELPITEQVNAILYEAKKPQAALEDLMSRDLKAEWDFG